MEYFVITFLMQYKYELVAEYSIYQLFKLFNRIFNIQSNNFNSENASPLEQEMSHSHLYLRKDYCFLKKKLLTYIFNIEAGI